MFRDESEGPLEVVVFFVWYTGLEFVHIMDPMAGTYCVAVLPSVIRMRLDRLGIYFVHPSFLLFPTAHP